MTHQVEGLIGSLFVMRSDGSDEAFYYYSVCIAQVSAVVVIILSVNTRCAVSTTQVCIFSMIGASVSQALHNSGTHCQISWMLFLRLGVLWLVTPIFTIFLSAALYWVTKKCILSSNTRIRAFIITPYISGIVFAIYFSFVFTTPMYQDSIFQRHKLIFGPIIIFLGFYIGMMFKRMHFFITRVTPRMRLCTLIGHSLCVLYHPL